MIYRMMHRVSVGWLLPTLIGAFLIYIDVDRGLFQYDEADYTLAARQGFLANYLETSAIPTQAFLIKGLKTFLIGDLPVLSREIRASGDVSFFRHYHPPFTVYLISLTDNLFGSKEFTLRLAIWFVATLTIPVVYWQLRLMLPDNGHWIGMLAATLIATSPMIHTTSAMISVHPLYVLTAILTFTWLIRFFQTNRIQYFYLFVACLAWAFTVNEYAIILSCVCLLCMILIPNDILTVTRRRISIDHHMFGGLVCLFGVFIILWPGGILKLTALKSYIYLFYIVFVKSTLSYGAHTLFDIWSARFMSAPVEMVLILFGLGYGLFGILTRRIPKLWLPLWCYPGIIFLANLLNKAAFNTYALSMYPFLLIFAAMGMVAWVQHQKAPWRRNAAITFIIGLIIANIVLDRYPPREDLTPLKTAFDTIIHGGSTDDRILVNFGYLPTVSYYLPEHEVSTIYLETKSVEVINWFSNHTYRYFIFLGHPEELYNSAYYPALHTHYQEIQRRPNDQDKSLLLFRIRDT